MDEALYRAVMADRQRQCEWVNRNAWKFEHLREQRRGQKRREAVARVLRALAARLAPESVVEHRSLAAEG